MSATSYSFTYKLTLLICSAAWERQQKAKAKGLTEAEVKDRPPRDPSLACPQCDKLLRDAVKTPCCQKDYCEECIHTHLLEGSFECPNCKSKIPSLDKLRIDSETRAKVREYVRNTVEESRRAAEQSVEVGSHVQEVCEFIVYIPGPISAFVRCHRSVVTIIAMAYASVHF